VRWIGEAVQLVGSGLERPRRFADVAVVVGQAVHPLTEWARSFLHLVEDLFNFLEVGELHERFTRLGVRWRNPPWLEARPSVWDGVIVYEVEADYSGIDWFGAHMRSSMTGLRSRVSFIFERETLFVERVFTIRSKGPVEDSSAGMPGTLIRTTWRANPLAVDS
jgi:hypothetical protein